MKTRSELDVRDDFLKQLTSAGKKFDTEVHVPGGKIDILTNDTIYEVKKVVRPSVAMSVVGQLLFYQYQLARQDLFGRIFGAKRKICCVCDYVEYECHEDVLAFLLKYKIGVIELSEYRLDNYCSRYSRG